MLIIRDIPSVMPQVDNLIRQLDRKTQQVEIRGARRSGLTVVCARHRYSVWFCRCRRDPQTIIWRQSR